MMTLLLAAACNKEYVEEEAGREIVFGVKGAENTKVTAITNANLPKIHVMAATDGGTTMEWVREARKNAAGNYSTGMYWPLTDPHYTFYATNGELEINNIVMEDGVAKLNVRCVSDMLAGYIPSGTFNQTNTIVMKHILTRIGDITVASDKGYTLTDISVTMSDVWVEGQYKIKTGDWIYTRAAGYFPVHIGANDIYVIPGTYPISVRATFGKGDYSSTFTLNSEVELQEGKITNINITLSNDPAVPIDFSVNVLDWDATDVTVTMS